MKRLLVTLLILTSLSFVGAFTFSKTPSHSYLRTSSAPDCDGTDYMTISCWFNVGDVTGSHTLVKIEFDDPDNNRYLLVARGDVAGDPVRFTSQNEGTSYTVDTTTAYTANTWHQVTALLNKSQSRAWIAIDGGAFVEGTGFKYPEGSESYIQISGDNAFVPAAEGRVAEVAIWSSGIAYGGFSSNRGSSSLADGVAPIHVLPANLLCYWPLIGGGLQDLAGGYDLTAYNSPVKGDHCHLVF